MAFLLYTELFGDAVAPVDPPTGSECDQVLNGEDN